MSFGSRGGSRGRGYSGVQSRGGYGGFRGGRGGSFASTGTPVQVLEMGVFEHAVEGDMLFRSTNAKIPHFNSQIFLENKASVGKVDEILGPINDVLFTVKPQEGIIATSFKAGDKVYIGSEKLLPLERFLPKPKVVGQPKVKKAPGSRGRGAPSGMRGGRGMGFGGRGGAPRGGGFTRGARGGGFARGGARGGRFGGSR